MDVTTINGSELISAFLVAVLVGLVVYGVSTIVPFLQPYKNVLGLVTFAIVLLLFFV